MKVVDPMGSAIGLYDPPPDYGGRAIRQERKRQGLIAAGTADINQRFAGFDQPFYDKRAQAYYNYALPQLGQQYTGLKNSLGQGLAERGLRNSGSAQTQYSNLQREMDTQRQGLADAGLAQSQQLKREVEGQRDTLLGQLYSTANPTMAGLSATRTAAGFASPSVYAPLGNMFSNLMNQYYARQLLNNYKPPTTPPPPGGGGGGGINPGAVPGNIGSFIGGAF